MNSSLLTSLPDNVIFLLFRHLDTRDAARLAGLCSFLRSFTANHQVKPFKTLNGSLPSSKPETLQSFADFVAERTEQVFQFKFYVPGHHVSDDFTTTLRNLPVLPYAWSLDLSDNIWLENEHFDNLAPKFPATLKLNISRCYSLTDNFLLTMDNHWSHQLRSFAMRAEAYESSQSCHSDEFNSLLKHLGCVEELSVGQVCYGGCLDYMENLERVLRTSKDKLHTLQLGRLSLNVRTLEALTSCSKLVSLSIAHGFVSQEKRSSVPLDRLCEGLSSLQLQLHLHLEMPYECDSPTEIEQWKSFCATAPFKLKSLLFRSSLDDLLTFISAIGGANIMEFPLKENIFAPLLKSQSQSLLAVAISRPHTVELQELITTVLAEAPLLERLQMDVCPEYSPHLRFMLESLSHLKYLSVRCSSIDLNLCSSLAASFPSCHMSFGGTVKDAVDNDGNRVAGIYKYNTGDRWSKYEDSYQFCCCFPL